MPKSHSIFGGAPPDPQPALADPSSGATSDNMRAADVKTFLDSRVVGQEQAKLMLSVLFSMHIHRTSARGSVQRPPNAIIVGPTGVGKTYTLRVASGLLKLPFLAVDSTTLVPSGGRGVQIGNIMQDLLAEARSTLDLNPDLKSQFTPRTLAERGVIFFDEFDKIAVFTKDSTVPSNQLDSWNLMIQRGMLKICEGAFIGIGVRDVEGASAEGLAIDTSGILVLAGGAFEGINDSKIRAKRPEALQREIKSKGVVSNDFISFGIMPELIARLQVLVEFKPLGSDELRSILDNVHTSPIEVWVDHFKKLGKSLEVTAGAKDYVASRASLVNLGARGLHQVLFPALAALTYRMETSEHNHVTIDERTIREALGAAGF